MAAWRAIIRLSITQGSVPGVACAVVTSFIDGIGGYIPAVHKPKGEVCFGKIVVDGFWYSDIDTPSRKAAAKCAASHHHELIAA